MYGLMDAVADASFCAWCPQEQASQDILCLDIPDYLVEHFGAHRIVYIPKHHLLQLARVELESQFVILELSKR
jgi:hypothetical protein